MPKTLQQVKDEPLKTLIETAKKSLTEIIYRNWKNGDEVGLSVEIQSLIDQQLTLAFSSGVHTTEERIKEEWKNIMRSCKHFGHTDGERIDCESEKMEKIEKFIEALTSNSTQE